MGEHADRFSIPTTAKDTVAYIVTSGPAMWEAFEEFWESARDDELPRSDPVDSFANRCIAKSVEALEAAAAGRWPGLEARVLSEGWNYAKSQAVVLVQTAGHVAGVARFYQVKDVEDRGLLEKWQDERRRKGEPDGLFPVAVHPRWGGWFAYRAVIVIDGLTCPSLPRVEPPDVLPTDSARSAALIKFSEGWSDRELPLDPPAEATYSANARLYFGLTVPRKEKTALLERIRAGTADKPAQDGSSSTDAAEGAGGAGGGVDEAKSE